MVTKGVILSSYEMSDLVIAALALFANFGALFFLAFEIRNARKESQKENTRRAREAIFNYYSSTLNERNNLRNELPELDSSDWQTIPEESRKVTRYLAYWEILASGINLGIYDFEAAKVIAGQRIITIWDNWLEFISFRRHSTNNKKLYCELEILVSLLKKSR
jgi:hypothetical protein